MIQDPTVKSASTYDFHYHQQSARSKTRVPLLAAPPVGDSTKRSF